jgi:phenylacetate-CoA ligase
MIHNEEQYKKLYKLLTKLKDNNEYYKDVLSNYNCDEKNINQTYEKIRPINKKTILNNLNRLIDKGFRDNYKNKDEMIKSLLDVSKLNGNHDMTISSNNKKWSIELTTGTTGKPFPIIKTNNEKMSEALYLLEKRKKIYNCASLSNGLLMIHQIEPELKSIDWGDNSGNMEIVCKQLHEKKPKWIFTTAFLLKKLCTFIESNDKTYIFDNMDIKFIETTSQTLSEDEKEHIEKVFKSKIINQYGCREVWNIAYECKCNNMHLNTKYLIVDLIDEEGNIINEDGVLGEIIITSLINNDMPLIKYYLGDLARIYHKKCFCGCEDPIIVLEKGRMSETISNTNLYGNVLFRKVLRRLYFHENFTEIEKIKVIQDGDYHFSIYMSLAERNEYFEERFVQISKYIEKEISKFIFDFIYDYPFKNSESAIKEQIYINTLLV